MTVFIDVLLLVLAAPALLACTYLLLLTLLSRRLPTPPPSSRSLRVQIVVPAHDEAAVITNTVRSLRQVDWPQEQLRIVVVADNCCDATEPLARAAGAEVWVRQDAERRGKGYALCHAFQRSLQEGWAEALIIVDADAEVTPNLVEACVARIEQGAQAVQVHYGILNPADSWRTRLLTIAQTAFHRVRSRARERLALSCGIRGNGWCVTRPLLEKLPYGAYSLAEDLEYGITLGLHGVRVHYADEAEVRAVMVSNEGSARSQRLRWERGRFEQLRLRTGPLLRKALRRRDPVCLDLALDLLVLPLSYIGLNVALLVLLAFTGAALSPDLRVWVWVSLAALLALSLHVLRGWQLSGIGWRGLLDLARAPLYLLWKLLLWLRHPIPREWVRTRREIP